MARQERRGAVRVPARLAMEIQVGADAERVESLNVSANGVYFASPRYIAPLTRLRVVLDLPGAKGRAKANVSVDGVVVRTEPEEESSGVDQYEIACYFTSISNGDRETLESYILTHVPF